MYNERKDTFSVRDIIIQGLCILLFIFLLIWLFPTKSYIKQNTTVSTDVQLVDALFNNNIQTMKEAALSYYTTSRLPDKVGESSTITLGKMIEEKLLLSFVDGNGDSCDLENSYVQLVKENDEYIMKVNLVCPSKSDYILVHLGCYDYCTGSICEKETETKKEIKKEVEKISYKYTKVEEGSCTESEWSNWSNTSVTASDTVTVESQYVSGSSSCETYAYKYDYVNPTSTSNVETDNTYCELGYTKSEDGKTCSFTLSKYYITYNTTNSCPTGYSFNSGKTLCLSNTSVNVTTETTEGSWVFNDTITYDSIKTTTSTTKYENPSVTYGVDSCDGCKYTVNYTYDVYTYKAGTSTTSCPSSYPTKIGTKCYKTADIVTTKVASGCSVDDYVLTNGACVKTIASHCAKGYTKSSDGSYCTKTTYATSCPTGYTFTDSTETSCKKTGELYCEKYSTTSGYYLYRYKTKTCTESKTLVKYSTTSKDTALIKEGYTYSSKVTKG